MNKLAKISLMLAILGTVAHADPKPPTTDPKAPGDKPYNLGFAPSSPQEVADMAKGMAGTWRCTGSASMGGAPLDFKATITHKLDLDKWWIQTSFTGTAGKLTYKFTAYTGFDSVGKKWHRYGVDNMGSARAQEAAGMTDGKMVWNGTGTQMGQQVTLRDTEELTKDGKSFHTLGEISTDGGKTWKTGHDGTCKK